MWERTTLGISQKEAAWRMGVDPSTLAQWERGERAPIDRELETVASFFGDDAKLRTRRAG